MSINPVVTGNTSPVVSNPCFKKKETRLVSVRKYPDFEERRYEVEASTGKKWGVGVASFFVSGLGQAINGDWGKAAGFFFGEIACKLLVGISASMGKKGAVGAGLGILGALGLDVWSIVDAVKSAKNEEIQIIPNINSSSDLNINA